jgi:hypothetical protein
MGAVITADQRNRRVALDRSVPFRRRAFHSPRSGHAPAFTAQEEAVVAHPPGR